MRAISEVERDTGLPRATIRIWERRYGFPAPVRDGRGERCYPDEQVEQLRLMRQLVQHGHRPATLLAQGPSELRRLADQERPSRSSPRPRGTLRLLRLLRAHDVRGLRKELEMRVARLGLEHFAVRDLPAMNSAVGDAWSANELEIHEEHLYSDCVDEVLRASIAGLGQATRDEAPQVLLTTFPQESHGLGLLMAQAIFALQGCPTVSLGVRLPIDQIVSSAEAYRADLIGLSFSGSMNPTHVQRGLGELRALLPSATRIWAGGHCPVLYRRPIAGVRTVKDLAAIPHLLAEDFALPPLPADGA